MTDRQLGDVWQETLKLIKVRLNVPTFKTMFSHTHPLSIYENTFVLSAPNAFVKDWLEKRHLPLISNSLSEVLGEEYKIKFIISADSEEAVFSSGDSAEEPGKGKDGKVSPVKSEADGLPDVNKDNKADFFIKKRGLRLNPKYTFESFIVGSCNRFAHAASLAVAERPSSAYNPFFIYGGVGLGKTHLLQAIAHYVCFNYKNLKVKYLTSESFTNDFINAVIEKNIASFQKKYRAVDVLLIDDIQFLAGKEQTQEEFFHTFNTLYEADKQVIISSDRPPKNISALEKRLRSRFEWGLITDIQPPDLEIRIAILKKKAFGEKLEISDEVFEYIASRVKSNIRELEGALIRVIAFSSLSKNPVSLELTKDILKDIFPDGHTRPVTINIIIGEVCKYFNISKKDILSPRRLQNIVYPRQIAMYLSRELTDLSLPKIGEEFGGKDHTTVLHAQQKVESLIKEEKEALNQVQEITNTIKLKC
ncbi:MAG: chromosomal replication initiator protein DnaA [Actinomycetia bacterium]|nr:chromosomal replication initiator protein DnaA [Actinomycetes bacterium]